jgi:hypothetical protein
LKKEKIDLMLGKNLERLFKLPPMKKTTMKKTKR